MRARSGWRSRRLIGAVVCILSGFPIGCVSGSLASSTGPRAPGQRWSDSNQQMVLRGEEVRFDFVLQDWNHRLVNPVGIAEYCVAFVGGYRIECEADVFGHFEFSHSFDHYKAGDVVEIQASAYHQRGSRDFMKIAGQWLHNDSPYELPDRKGVSDSITLTVYESPIELTIPRSGSPLDPQSGLLRIRRNPESVVSILVDRPDRPGFSLRSPDETGSYVVRYVPGTNELNTFGKTEIEFTIRDVVGTPIMVQSVIETP